MIKQPELGLKIAELRKAKGLTQEQLVNKCNLSVRTLQRIEYGEVSPRTYTIKMIFEALELTSDNSFEDLLKPKKGLISKWLEQFYISFVDLFNLKTNTMKKITILSIMISALILGIFVVNTNLSAKNNYKTQTPEILNDENKKEQGLTFSFFTAHGSMEIDGFLIARDISFTLAGVKINNIRLLALNQKTREFESLFVDSGIFLKRKVEVDYPKDLLFDGDLEYSADQVKKTDAQIILKGNAKIFDLHDKDNLEDDESIEADEIIINFK